jgi:hypothetical protein
LKNVSAWCGAVSHHKDSRSFSSACLVQRWGILCALSPADGLLDSLKEELSGPLQHIGFITLRDFDFVLECPKP